MVGLIVIKERRKQDEAAPYEMDKGMTQLTLAFLGQFQVTLADQPVTAFANDKARGLLAYLAVETKVHARSTLATLLWSAYTEESARTNLRQALHQLREAIGDADSISSAEPNAAQPPFLLVTRSTIQFNPDADYTLDVTRFLAHVARCTAHAHLTPEQCPACLAELRQAVDLYQGEFLQGFVIEDSAPFEEWRLIIQEQLHLHVMEALSKLVNAYVVYGDDEHVRHYANRQLALEPWCEEAHRQIMRILARSGQRSAALAQYQQCRQVLANEFGVAPDGETNALYEQIRNGNFDKGMPPRAQQIAQPAPLSEGGASDAGVERRTLVADRLQTRSDVSPASLRDWDKMPTVRQFHGRGRELATLTDWISNGRSRLIMVLGIGGVGKTALVAQTVRTVADQFAGVIWSSLLNAPPLSELLPQWLRVLTQPAGSLPSGEEEQVRLLLQCLSRQRCLLVLDNAESILGAENTLGAENALGRKPEQEAGAWRPGYENYAHLLQSLSQDNQRSCLLITSRELPRVLNHWRDHTPTVQVLSLAGLEAEAGQALLQAQGLASDDQATLALVRHYSGNPLALQIVSHTIADLYDGDIRAFTAEGAPIFDDVRAVLDQQVARLSSLESELLFWLAIEREPITLATLRNNLVDKGSQRTFLEAVRALQRRSLLEKVGDGFTLQNVIIEYLTDRFVEGVCAELLISDRETGRQGDGASLRENSSLSLFNRHALLKAGATESVRQSQVRLIFRPIAERWLAKLGKQRLVQQARGWLDWLRNAEAPQQGYAAGNLLNLLLHLQIDVADFDFSGLAVWQAYLRGAYLPGIDFTNADLSGSVFTHRFGDIQALRYGPDGDADALIVAGIREGALRIWRAVTGELRNECSIAGIRPISVGWSNDGRLAAVVDAAPGSGVTRGPLIHLFDVESGRRLTMFTGPANPIWRICFSADGQQVACGDTSGQVTVWATTGQPLYTLHGHANAITALAYAMGNGRKELLASGAVDGVVCLWNTLNGELIHRLPGHVDEVSVLGFAQNGNVLVTGSHDFSVRLWDVESGRILHTLQRHTQPIRNIAVTPTGNLLATGSGDKLIYLWDIQRGEVLHVLGDQTIIVAHLCFSPDEQTLATFDLNGALCLWEVQSGQRLNAFQVYRNAIRSADFSPDQRLVAAGGGDGAVYLWNVGEPPLDDGGNPPTDTERTQVARSARTVAVAPCGAGVGPRLWARLPGQRHSIAAVAFHPDSETLASGDTGQTILLRNLRRETQITLRGHRSNIVALSFTADGRLLASGSGDGTVGVWGTDSGQKLHTLRGHTNAVTSCRFGLDGAQLASGSIDLTVCLWDAEHGELRHRLRGHTNAVQSVTFSADGQQVISSGFDQSLRVWDVRTGQLLATWPTPNTVFLALAVHPAGAVLAAGAQDHLIYLLDLGTGRVLGALGGHSHIVNSLTFSRDGRLLLSASHDETVKLWQVDVTSGYGVCCQTLTPPGPYAGMKIADVTGLSEAQKAALKALGAVEEVTRS